MALSNYLAAGAAFTALPVLSALALAEHGYAKRTLIIDADAADLYALAVSNEGFQRFNPYCDTDPDLKIELYGPSTGIGSGFSFDGKDGKGTQTVADAVENRRVTYAVDLGMMGKPTQQILFEPVSGGTRVVWEVHSHAGYNPLKRLANLFLDRFMGQTLERGLRNLATAA